MRGSVPSEGSRPGTSEEATWSPSGMWTGSGTRIWVVGSKK